MSGFWGFVSRIVSPLTELASEYITDADKLIEFEHRARMQMMDNEATFVEASRDVVVAEAQSESWLARNWRPITALSFTAIIVNNYILVPWLQVFSLPAAVLDMPPELFTLLTVMIGGYVVGRSMEKTESGINLNMGQPKNE